MNCEPGGPHPRVSVVMAVHNDERFVGEAVASISEQTFSDFEFIIIDDGSTDNTPTILSELAAVDSRIMLVRDPQIGLAAALNRGLALACGEFVARQDSDDASTLTRLEKQVKFLDQNPEVSLVGSLAEVMDGDGYTVHEMQFPIHHEELCDALPRRMVFQHGALVFRRRALEDVGGYRIEFPICEDYDLLLRFIERYRVANYPEVLYFYRRTGANMTAKWISLVNLYMDLAKECALQRREYGQDVFQGTAQGPESCQITPGGVSPAPRGVGGFKWRSAANS